MAMAMDARPSKRARTAASGWSELLPEIAGGILCRVTSFADRARFRSVCRQWRLAAQQQDRLLPPALPWLTTADRGVFVSLPDGGHHRLPIHVGGARSCEAFGEWLLFDLDHQHEYLLMNPLSKASTKLPGRFAFHDAAAAVDDDPAGNVVRPGAVTVRSHIKKLVVVARPSSSGDGGMLVAAIVTGRIGYQAYRRLALCRPGAHSWVVRHAPGGDGLLQDIALYRGKIYALYGSAELVSYDLDVGAGEETAAASGGASGSAHCIRAADAGPELHKGMAEKHCFERSASWLVVSACGDTLLMVRRVFTTTLKVFAADLDASRWSSSQVITSLEGQLLFLSDNCSRSLRASDYGGAAAAARGGRMFLTDDGTRRLLFRWYDGKYTGGIGKGFGVYDMSTGKFDRKLLPDGACDGCCHLTGSWFFPSILS